MTSEKSTSDLQTLLHYNRPKSTPPAANLTSKEESTFGGPFRASSVVPFDSRASDERTPLIGVVRGQSDTFSQNEEEDDEETFDKQSLRDYFSWKNKWTILNHIKIAVLLIITSVCCCSILKDFLR